MGNLPLNLHLGKPEVQQGSTRILGRGFIAHRKAAPRDALRQLNAVVNNALPIDTWLRKECSGSLTVHVPLRLIRAAKANHSTGGRVGDLAAGRGRVPNAVQ